MLVLLLCDQVAFQEMFRSESTGTKVWYNVACRIMECTYCTDLLFLQLQRGLRSTYLEQPTSWGRLWKDQFSESFLAVVYFTAQFKTAKACTAMSSV